MLHSCWGVNCHATLYVDNINMFEPMTYLRLLVRRKFSLYQISILIVKYCKQSLQFLFRLWSWRLGLYPIIMTKLMFQKSNVLRVSLETKDHVTNWHLLIKNSFSIQKLKPGFNWTVHLQYDLSPIILLCQWQNHLKYSSWNNQRT